MTLDDVIHVLLVEDDEDDFIIARDLLAQATESDFRLTWTGTLAEALERIGKTPVSVILLDLSLPDSQGWETLQAVQEAAPELPVIILTGLDDGSMATRAIEAGAQDYLCKGDVDGDRLVRGIRYSIGRKAAEQALHTSNERYRTLYESSRDGIVHMDMDGHLQHANRSMLDMLGYKVEDLASLTFSDITPPRWHEADQDFIHNQILKRGYSDEYEKELVKRDGQAFPVSVRAWLVKAAPERPVGIWAIIRDITDRKMAESALKLYRDHLEDLVRRRTGQLSETNRQLEKEISERKATEKKLHEAVEQLQENDRARSEFVSNVSHELKTPLSSMTYALENMDKGIVGPIPDRAKNYLAMLAEDCQRLTKTINDILDLSRIESQTLTLNRVKLSLGYFVAHTVHALQLQAEAKNLTLELKLDDCKSFCFFDPEKLERVVMNIVQNAIKYTDEGGRIEVRLRIDSSNDALLALDVIDNGIGIDPEHLPRVTERFFRVGEHVSGTGLGLSLCREILELHGGHIRLSSPPEGRENGTQVSAFLPLTEPAHALAVDDDSSSLGTLQKQLQSSGYTVTTCRNGKEALQALESGQLPDILVVDLFMPVMNGIETIAHIKGNHTMRKLPILAITGGEIDRPKREILQGFGIPALGKPWKHEQLLHSLQEAIIGRQYAVH